MCLDLETRLARRVRAIAIELLREWPGKFANDSVDLKCNLEMQYKLCNSR